MDIVTIFLTLHSLVRFVILLVALAGLVLAIIALVQKNAPQKIDQTLGSIFLGTFDLQALLGILIIFFGGLIQPVHPIVMFVGMVVGHGIQTMSKRAEGQTTHWYRIALYVIPLAIIIFGFVIIQHFPV